MRKKRYRGGYYGAAIDALRAAWGGKCVVCGTNKKLEFAHLKETGLWGRGRGLPQRVHNIKKHPDKYVLLCKGCHKQFDRGEALGT